MITINFFHMVIIILMMITGKNIIEYIWKRFMWAKQLQFRKKSFYNKTHLLCILRRCDPRPCCCYQIWFVFNECSLLLASKFSPFSIFIEPFIINAHEAGYIALIKLLNFNGLKSYIVFILRSIVKILGTFLFIQKYQD